MSLLGTWGGKGTETWTPNSNMLQLLVSIQGLILVPEVRKLIRLFNICLYHIELITAYEISFKLNHPFSHIITKLAMSDKKERNKELKIQECIMN